MIKSKFKAFKSEFPGRTIESALETIFREDFSNECGGLFRRMDEGGIG